MKDCSAKDGIALARFINLYSGSSGNCTYIKTPDVALLFDAGRSAAYLKRALESVGESIDAVSALFLTHSHVDHTSAVRVLVKKRQFKIYAVADTASATSIHCHIDEDRFVCFDDGDSISFGATTVTSFPASHDSEHCVGYRIDFTENGVRRSFGIMTDTGYVTEHARRALIGCEAVMLESNHDVDMLQRGPYPDSLKARILSPRGHLSNRDCSVFCRELALSGTNRFMLAHLSEENNLPSIARLQTEGMLTGTDASVYIASPSLATILI